MNLQRVRLRGFIGLYKGMGVEEIDLDLSGLTGLVALEGDNGKGKTTFLENLQAFRTLPSRKGTLKSHCYLKDSAKELWFNMAGDEYRALVKMDATTTVPDEGFIWKNGEPQVNGKVSEFDRYLIKLLGSSNLFFNSIFCAQNSAKLSDLRPAELKTLYAEFLKLDRYIAWEKTAKAAGGLYINAITDLEVQKKRLITGRELLGSPRKDLENAEKVRNYLDTQQIEIKERIDNAQIIEEVGKDAVKAQIKNAVKLKAANEERTRMKTEAEKKAKDFEGTCEDLMQKIAGIELDAKAAEITLEDSEEIQAASKLFQRAEDKIHDLRLECDVLDIESADLVDLIKNETHRLTVVDKLLADCVNDRTCVDLAGEIANIKARISGHLSSVENIKNAPALVKIKAEYAALKKSAIILNEIDIDCTSKTCGLIAQSRKDSAAMPEVEKQYHEAEKVLIRDFNLAITCDREAVARLQAKSDAHKKEVDAMLLNEKKTRAEITACLDILEKDLNGKKPVLHKSRQDIEDWTVIRTEKKALADRSPEVAIARSRKKDLDKQANEIKIQVAKLEMAYLKEGKDLTDAIAKNQKVIEALDGLSNPEAEKALETAEEEVRLSRAAGVQNFEAAVTVKADIEKAEKAIEGLKEIERNIKGLDSLTIRFRDQAGQWSYLEEACSKDGLRALEIEGVAPVITGHANDMLSGTFGPNNSVRFETQDENGKEVLDIVVIGDDGSETLLTNLSGGERVWILKALRLAQTLISQEKSGRHFETALMDEEDGALSNENAIRFIGLYRKLMEIAKMNACYYISHRPDAIHLADHRIKFKEGGLQVI